MRHPRTRRGALALGAALASSIALSAAAEELNLYSSRHYQTDDDLYAGFTEATGITVNRIEANADELIQRILAEGDNSPADVFITVDAGRLWRADEADLFRPVQSDELEARIPEALRHPDGHWFGFSTRARLIFYNKDLIDPDAVGLADYEDLAKPELAGLVCIRSSSNIYNLSLLASLIAHNGAEEAEAWAAGIVSNFARPPQGGDTDQLTATAAGECAVAVANHYYYLRLLTSEDEDKRAVAGKLGVIFPNRDGRGAHVNVSGAGILKTAPNPEAALQFLEYLATDEAQALFANGNNEFPAVAGAETGNTALAGIAGFRTDSLNVAALGENQAEAQRIYDKVGWP